MKKGLLQCKYGRDLFPISNYSLPSSSNHFRHNYDCPNACVYVPEYTYLQNNYFHLNTPFFNNSIEEPLSVIIEFKEKPLLSAFPQIIKQHGSLKNHPYRSELQKKNRFWITQLKNAIPIIDIHHLYDVLISGISITIPRGAFDILKKLPFIKRATLDEKLRYYANYAPETTPLANDQNIRNLEVIGIPRVWKMRDRSNREVKGEEIRVAVIDEAINVNDLIYEGSAEERFGDRYNFDRKSTDVSGKDNHGTILSQIILDVAPRVTLLSYAATTAANFVAAVERAMLNNATIISTSGEQSTGRYNISSLDLVSEAEAIAEQAGVVIVTAAGNNWFDTDVASYGYFSYTISVGATTADGQKVAPYSNYGYILSTRQIKPDLVAPGDYIFQSKSINGTSFAQPYVAGSVALIQQMHPKWNPQKIKAALTSTSTRIEEKDRFSSFSQGSGRINTYEAINTTTLFYPTQMSFEKNGKKTEKILNRGGSKKKYYLTWQGAPNHLQIYPNEVEINGHHYSKVSISVERPNFFGLLSIRQLNSRKSWHIPVIAPTPYFIAIGEVRVASLSPDGRWIGSVSMARYESDLKIWDSISRKSVKNIVETIMYGGPIFQSISFSPDSTKVASGCGNQIRIYSVEQNGKKPIKEITAGSNDNPIKDVQWAPDGRSIASGSSNGEIRVWDVDTKELLRNYNSRNGLTSLSWGYGGKYLGSGSENIQIWDLESGSTVPFREYKIDETLGPVVGATIFSVSLDQLGKFVAAGTWDEKVRVWDIASGSEEPTVVFSTYNSRVFSVAFRSDGKLLVTGGLGLPLHSNNINSLATLYLVQVWDMDSRSQQPVYEFKTHHPIYSVNFSTDGKKVISGSGNVVQIWDL